MTMLHGYMQTYSSLFSDTKKPQSLLQKQKKKIEDDDIHTDIPIPKNFINNDNCFTSQGTILENEKK